jgi:hypothetical protein
MALDAEAAKAAKAAAKKAKIEAMFAKQAVKYEAEQQVGAKLAAAGVDTKSEDGAKKAEAMLKLKQNEVFKFIQDELPNLLSGNDKSGVSLPDKIIKLLDGTRQKEAAQNDSYNEASNLAAKLKGIFGAGEFIAQLTAAPNVDAPSSVQVDDVNAHAAILLASKKKLSDGVLSDLISSYTDAKDVTVLAKDFFGVSVGAEVPFEMQELSKDNSGEVLLGLANHIYKNCIEVA